VPAKVRSRSKSLVHRFHRDMVSLAGDECRWHTEMADGAIAAWRVLKDGMKLAIRTQDR